MPGMQEARKTAEVFQRLRRTSTRRKPAMKAAPASRMKMQRSARMPAKIIHWRREFVESPGQEFCEKEFWGEESSSVDFQASSRNASARAAKGTSVMRRAE